MAARISSVVVRGPKSQAPPKGCIVVLHGSGDTGHGIQQWFDMESRSEWHIDGTKMLFPTAAPMFYRPFQCSVNVWFDRLAVDAKVPELVTSIDEGVAAVSSLIEKEVQQGTPINKIIVGGFSQGATLALHLGYRKFRDIAGVFALSGFLNDSSVVYECHGTADPITDFAFGRETHQQLTARGVEGDFHRLEGVGHELHGGTIEKLNKWIQQRLLSNS